MKVEARRMKKKLIVILSAVAALYFILLIPAENYHQPKIADKKQFVWNRDSLWHSLEALYAQAKMKDCRQMDGEISNSFRVINDLLDSVELKSPPAADAKYLQLESALFRTTAQIGACRERTKEFIDLFSRIRSVIKSQSRNWNMADIQTRQTLYKLIYGGRAAVEELLLQYDKKNISPLINGSNESSATPASEFLGVQIHSGDILISRGGAPTSALIARGNDYPGNFSHVALVYVDEKTKAVSIIESHIERGVVISSAEDYLKDKKLRVMVLRLRADHGKLFEDKMIPHKAAEIAYLRALANHIPYDFEMNYKDDSKLFCSEVASSAYKKLGVNLWMGLSSISSPGVADWLAGFGVKYFETQEPSDLEYDPQLTVAAEWRDTESLLKDHIDNAIIEALLEKAESGKKLSYDWYMLPFARIAKGYSLLLNLFGKEGPVPEGMGPESALRHKKLVGLHETIFEDLEKRAKYFKEEKGYSAPYWRLVEIAQNIIEEKKLI